jgi:hypothetical protein
MTVHVCVHRINRVERLGIGVELSGETFTLQPRAASAGGR